MAPDGAPGEAGVLPEICSGCDAEELDSNDTTVRVHHLHLNGRDESAAFDYYERFYPASRVLLNGKREALWAAPLLILFDEVPDAPPDALEMGLDHFGWWSPDPAAWFESVSDGVEGDTRSGSAGVPVTIPQQPPLTSDLTFVYLKGPNAERVEVYTGTVEELRHIHFLSPNVDATVPWYADLLGVAPNAEQASVSPIFSSNAIDLGPVQLFFAGPPFPVPETFVPTDDRPIGHVAFSVENLDRMFSHANDLGVEIVSPPARTDYGFRSFFARGPEQVLVEFVEAGELRLDEDAE